MERDKEQLLQEMLQPEGTPAESRALITRAAAEPPVVELMRELQRYIPADAGDELSDFFRFALLGVSVGFRERNLSPRDQAHLAIIPPLLDDIRSVYDRLHELGTAYDREEFRFRAYDYGIHKAYYLDWQLYLSKELY